MICGQKDNGNKHHETKPQNQPTKYVDVGHSIDFDVDYRFDGNDWDSWFVVVVKVNPSWPM
jgi:hypothetical protein